MHDGYVYGTSSVRPQCGKCGLSADIAVPLRRIALSGAIEDWTLCPECFAEWLIARKPIREKRQAARQADALIADKIADDYERRAMMNLRGPADAKPKNEEVVI